MTLDAHADALYSGDPATFVARRDELVRELRAAGHKADAATVKALRRPTAAAAALNAVARDAPDLVTAAVEAADVLTKTQRRALSGLAGADVRGAVRAHHLTIAAVIHAASSQPVSVADAMRATLLTAAVDPQVADKLRRGVLATSATQADTSAALLLSAPLTAVGSQAVDAKAGLAAANDATVDGAAEGGNDDADGAGDNEALANCAGEEARLVASEAKAAREAAATRQAAEEEVTRGERALAAARAEQVATARKRRTATAAAEVAASEAAAAATTVARLRRELAQAEAAQATADAVQEEAEVLLDAAVGRDDAAAQVLEQAQRTLQHAVDDLAALPG